MILLLLCHDTEKFEEISSVMNLRKNIHSHKTLHCTHLLRSTLKGFAQNVVQSRATDIINCSHH